MRRASLLFILFILVSSCRKQDADVQINFITSDVDLFWELYDSGDYSQENILDNYLAKGTPGLFDFAIQKSLSTGLTFTLNQEKFQRYYNSIRENTLDVKGEIDTAEKAFLKLKELYPETEFYNVFLIIGALSAGGRISDNGLIIALELFAESDDTDISALSDWQQSVVRSSDFLPSIIVHEFIHLQQQIVKEQSSSGTLLEQAIIEGMSDYLTLQLLPDEPFFNDHLYDFGDLREEALWDHFKTEMNDLHQDTEWLYTGANTSRGYPADMGYYVGFKIVESYAATFQNKENAIAEMLKATDYLELFERSGYADKFE